jgi:tetratricopeptide (TPR) repeat protein
MALTQHQLAEMIAYSRTTVANVETGRQPAGRDFWKRADTAVTAGGKLLASFDTFQRRLLDPGRTEAEAGHRGRSAVRTRLHQDEDVERRDFLRVLSMAGASLALPNATASQRHVPDDLLDQYAEMNAGLWRVFSLAASKQAAMPLVHDQLRTLTSHHRDAQQETTRRRLCALTGDLFQLAGEIHFDGNRYGDAAHAYTLAATASQDARDFDLWAASLVRHSFLSLYDQQPDNAAAMLDLARRLAVQGDSSLSTRYWVAAVQAQAYAALNDHTACERALDEAELPDATTVPGGWLRFDAERLPEERGACYVQLGRSDLAERALTQALASRSSSRRRGSVLTDLATVGVQQRDTDRVVTYAREAITLAQNTESGWVNQKLRGLRRQLRPMLDDSRVRAVSEQIP